MRLTHILQAIAVRVLPNRGEPVKMSPRATMLLVSFLVAASGGAALAQGPGHYCVFDAAGVCVGGDPGVPGCPGYVFPYEFPYRAIWNVPAGGAIVFGPGSFTLANEYGNNPPMWTEAGEIRGAGRGVTRLHAPANSAQYIRQAGAPRNRVIRALTLDGAYVAFTWQTGGARVTLQDVEIMNALYGVYTQANSSVLINNCNIHDINFSGVAAGMGGYGQGDLTVQNSTISGTGRQYNLPDCAGIVLRNSDVTVIDSDIDDNIRFGIAAQGASSITVLGGSVSRNLGALGGAGAINVFDGEPVNVTLDGVTIASNGVAADRHGVSHRGFCAGGSVRVTDCVITGNGGRGLITFNGGRTEIVNNTVVNNGAGDIHSRPYGNLCGGGPPTNHIANNIADNILLDYGAATNAANLTAAQAAPLDASYVPQAGSAALDTGVSALSDGTPVAGLVGETDHGGDPRFFCAGIDIGAQESQVDKTLLEPSL